MEVSLPIFFGRVGNMGIWGRIDAFFVYEGAGS